MLRCLGPLIEYNSDVDRLCSLVVAVHIIMNPILGIYRDRIYTTISFAMFHRKE